MNRECSVAKELVIERASRRAYEELAGWHYRGRDIGPYTAIFGARAPGEAKWAAVIVYGMPQIGSEVRGMAMAQIDQKSKCKKENAKEAGMWNGANGLAERIKWLNANVRCISRIVVDPRYRGIGLAVRLVRQTLPLAGVPIVEALAAMGEVNPFFERAGMRRFDSEIPARCIRMTKALEAVGIGRELFIDPRAVHADIDSLPGAVRLFVEAEMRLFLKSYVKKRNMPHGFERTRFVLSRLGTRPVYYVWKSNEKAVRKGDVHGEESEADKAADAGVAAKEQEEGSAGGNDGSGGRRSERERC
jgi:GNAT superfamily N-acetyltransferase